MDTVWKWWYEETTQNCIKNTFGREVGPLKGNSNYKFTASATKSYEWAKEYFPEMYEDCIASSY